MAAESPRAGDAELAGLTRQPNAAAVKQMRYGIGIPGTRWNRMLTTSTTDAPDGISDYPRSAWAAAYLAAQQVSVDAIAYHDALAIGAGGRQHPFRLVIVGPGWEATACTLRRRVRTLPAGRAFAARLGWDGCPPMAPRRAARRARALGFLRDRWGGEGTRPATADAVDLAVDTISACGLPAAVSIDGVQLAVEWLGGLAEATTRPDGLVDLWLDGDATGSCCTAEQAADIVSRLAKAPMAAAG